MIGLVAIAVSAVGWLNYRNLEQALLLRARDRIETHSRQLATDLEYYAASAIGDVAASRSAVALHGLIRAHRSGGIDPVDGVSEKTWRDRLASRFAAELEAKPAYAMLRIIGLDDDGRELVRVDRAGPNDTVRIVPEEGLRARNSRSYFPETIRLGPGQIYVSSLDLGRRNGLIEEVHRPTLRIATPIFADDGKLFGIFMINVDMRRAFERVRSSVLPGETIYVVNKQGDYLIHPDRSREFGALLGKPNDWKADFPHLAPQAGATQGSADIVPDQAAQPGGIALAPALLAGVEWVGVIETAPNAVIMAPAASIRNTSLLVGGIAVLCAAVLALLIARSLTRQEQEDRHSGRRTRRDRRARARICASDRRSERKDRRPRTGGSGASPHRGGARPSCRAGAAVQCGGRILQRRHHHDVARRHHHRLELGGGAAVRIQRGGSHGREHHVACTRRSAAGAAGRAAPDRLGRKHRTQ